MSRRIESGKASMLMVALVLMGLAGYLLPWIVASSGPMTLNAFDLAEWASLVPAQRGTSPPLVVPLLLRTQPVLLSLLLGVIAVGRKEMAIAALAICLLATAQLPPFEYVYDINNLNYRQQFVLAAVSLVAGLLLLPLGRRWIALAVKMALAISGIGTAALGLSGAMALFSQFGLAAAQGAGIWILILCYALMIALVFYEAMRARGAWL